MRLSLKWTDRKFVSQIPQILVLVQKKWLFSFMLFLKRFWATELVPSLSTCKTKLVCTNALLLTPSELGDTSPQSRQGLFISWNPYVSYNGISLDSKGIWPRFQLWMGVSRSSDGVRRSALVQTNLVLYVLNDGTNSVAQNPIKTKDKSKKIIFLY